MPITRGLEGDEEGAQADEGLLYPTGGVGGTWGGGGTISRERFMMVGGKFDIGNCSLYTLFRDMIAS